MLFYYLSGLMMVLMSMFCFFLSLVLLIFKKIFFMEWEFLLLNSFTLNMFLYIDWMCLMYMFVVLLISSMIMFYSTEYMIYDFYKIRFFFLMILFIMSMLLMILSPNMISILIGWDGLGLISYCLVIYYQSYSSFNSGMLTVLMNRIGDVFILMSLGLMIMNGSWNFLFLNNLNNLILCLIILASFTKSAIFPFSSWLPAAMAAPTPVSSLVHSSTLVTAGVYLLIRFHYLIYKNNNLLFYIFISGLITMLMAGFSANVEFDLKKIIAYSTLSQLGLMMMIIGMKYFELSYFHLIIHAVFKSMMFMCAGLMIHSLMNYQDIRYMGMLKEYMPLTSMVFMIANFSLCGMPFFSGFYSKDQILEIIIMKNLNLMCYFFLIIGTGLTVSYSVRLIYYLMSNSFNFFPMNNLGDVKLMNFSMFILLILTILFGYYMNWILFSMIDLIYMMMFEKILILILSFLFVILGMFMFKSFYSYNFYIKYFFGKMWFLYNLNFIFVNKFLLFGMIIFKEIDKGFMEYFFKNSLLKFTYKLNMNLNLLNNNYLMNFMLMILYIMIFLFLLF